MSEDICALVRENLLALCDAHIAKTRQVDDPFGDIKLARRGLETSRAIIEAVPVESSLDDYVFNLQRPLAAEWALAMEAGEEDPDHRRAGGIRTILDEVEDFAATLGPTPQPPLRPFPAANLLTLFESQLPFVRALHERGSLAPVGAFMDADGAIHGETLTDELWASLSPGAAINHFIRRHLAALRDGSIKAGAVYFHAAVSDDGVSPVSPDQRINAVIARLQNSEGDAMQALMRYHAATTSDGSAVWTYDEPVFIKIPALHLVASVSLAWISGDRPESFLWSSDPLRVVSADGIFAITTNGQGDAMVWRTEGNVPTYLLEGDGATILACALTANGEVAMTSASDGMVILWDALQGVRIANLALDIAHTDVAFSADGDHIALLAADGQYTCFRVF